MVSNSGFMRAFCGNKNRPNRTSTEGTMFNHRNGATINIIIVPQEVKLVIIPPNLRKNGM
jgi:hypothetical protein